MATMAAPGPVPVRASRISEALRRAGAQLGERGLGQGKIAGADALFFDFSVL